MIILLISPTLQGTTQARETTSFDIPVDKVQRPRPDAILCMSQVEFNELSSCKVQCVNQFRSDQPFSRLAQSAN